jgi:putative YphP/YqiW family bacilliredoxin
MPMYPEVMLVPMREELTRAGVEELRSAEEVASVLDQKEGTVMLVVNSVCGCAAGKMRPGVRLALENARQSGAAPDKAVSVFAGQDREATEKARAYTVPFPPSSPSIGILRDGKLVYFMQRSDIEIRPAQEIAGLLVEAFKKYCAKTTA